MELHDYAAVGDADSVRTWLQSNPDDVDCPDVEGWTPLTLAVRNGYFTVVKALIENHANVDLPAGWRRVTALHLAAQNGNAVILKALLDAGAKTRARAYNGATPLRTAARNGKLAIAKELLSRKGVWVNAKDDDGFTPLHDAAGYSSTEMVGLLLSHNADVNSKTASNDTPLHFAVRRQDQNLDLVRLLLENGADVSAQNSSDLTPLDEAKVAKKVEIVSILSSHLGGGVIRGT